MRVALGRVMELLCSFGGGAHPVSGGLGGPFAQRLSAHAREHWPRIEKVVTRYRAGFVCLDAILDGEQIKLCRLRYVGYANQWGLAIYRASHDDYNNAFLPTGTMGGAAEEALDTAAWLSINPGTASGEDHWEPAEQGAQSGGGSAGCWP